MPGAPAIWTDQPGYVPGALLAYCYLPQVPANVTVTLIRTPADQQVLLSGFDDGSGGCQEFVVSPPAGPRILRLTVEYGGEVTAEVETQFQVLAPPAGSTP